MKDKLLEPLTGFRKNHSTQHCLSYILQIWKKVIDKGGCICAIFMDLPIAFDSGLTLLTAKLEQYGFETDALRYMESYLTNRKQIVRYINLLVVGEDNYRCAARLNIRTSTI